MGALGWRRSTKVSWGRDIGRPKLEVSHRRKMQSKKPRKRFWEGQSFPLRGRWNRQRGTAAGTAQLASFFGSGQLHKAFQQGRASAKAGAVFSGAVASQAALPLFSTSQQSMLLPFPPKHRQATDKHLVPHVHSPLPLLCPPSLLFLLAALGLLTSPSQIFCPSCVDSQVVILAERCLSHTWAHPPGLGSL